MTDTSQPATDEPITDIAELNDLREKVLKGENIPPEKYLTVLQFVRKVRRDRGDRSGSKPDSKPKIDVKALLSGLKPKGT